MVPHICNIPRRQMNGAIFEWLIIGHTNGVLCALCTSKIIFALGENIFFPHHLLAQSFPPLLRYWEITNVECRCCQLNQVCVIFLHWVFIHHLYREQVHNGHSTFQCYFASGYSPHNKYDAIAMNICSLIWRGYSID